MTKKEMLREAWSYSLKGELINTLESALLLMIAILLFNYLLFGFKMPELEQGSNFRFWILFSTFTIVLGFFKSKITRKGIFLYRRMSPSKENVKDYRKIKKREVEKEIKYFSERIDCNKDSINRRKELISFLEKL